MLAINNVGVVGYDVQHTHITDPQFILVGNKNISTRQAIG